MQPTHAAPATHPAAPAPAPSHMPAPGMLQGPSPALLPPTLPAPALPSLGLDSLPQHVLSHGVPPPQVPRLHVPTCPPPAAPLLHAPVTVTHQPTPPLPTACLPSDPPRSQSGSALLAPTGTAARSEATPQPAVQPVPQDASPAAPPTAPQNLPRRGTFDLTSHNRPEEAPLRPDMPAAPPPRKSRPRPRPSRPKQTPQSSTSSALSAPSEPAAASATASTLPPEALLLGAAALAPSLSFGSPTQHPPPASGPDPDTKAAAVPSSDLSDVEAGRPARTHSSAREPAPRTGRKRRIVDESEEEDYQPSPRRRPQRRIPRRADAISSEDAEAIRRALAPERPRRAARKQPSAPPPPDETPEAGDEDVPPPPRTARISRTAPSPLKRTRKPATVAVSDDDDDDDDLPTSPPARARKLNQGHALVLSDQDPEWRGSSSPQPSETVTAKVNTKALPKTSAAKKESFRSSRAQSRADKKGKAAATSTSASLRSNPIPSASDEEALTPPPGPDAADGRFSPGPGQPQLSSPGAGDTSIVPHTPAASRSAAEPSSGAEVPTTSVGDVSFGTSHGPASTVSTPASRVGRRSFYGKRTYPGYLSINNTLACTDAH